MRKLVAALIVVPLGVLLVALLALAKSEGRAIGGGALLATGPAATTVSGALRNVKVTPGAG